MKNVSYTCDLCECAVHQDRMREVRIVFECNGMSNPGQDRTWEHVCDECVTRIAKSTWVRGRVGIQS